MILEADQVRLRQTINLLPIKWQALDLPFKTGLSAEFVDPLSDFCGVVVVGDSELSSVGEDLGKEGTNSIASTFNVENFEDKSLESFAPLTSDWLSQESGAPLLDILHTDSLIIN